MDRREQLRFICIVISMTSCVAYSYGMFTLPSLPFRKIQTKVKEEQAKDNRNDGGTESVNQKNFLLSFYGTE